MRAQRHQAQEKMKQLKQAIYNLENNKNSLYNDSLYKSGLLEQRKELGFLRGQLADRRKERIFEVGPQHTHPTYTTDGDIFICPASYNIARTASQRSTV